MFENIKENTFLLMLSSKELTYKEKYIYDNSLKKIFNYFHCITLKFYLIIFPYFLLVNLSANN